MNWNACAISLQGAKSEITTNETEDKTMRVKRMRATEANKRRLEKFPNFSATGSVIGMKKLYYGKDALLVRCGSWIYNVTSEPGIYYGNAY